MEQDFTHLGEEDLRLYKAMKRWHNEVGKYARLCERRLAAPLMLDASYSGTIVEYYFSKLFIISVLSSFSRLLCVIVRSL